MVALAQTADAWTEFWREQGPDSRCLANAAFDLRCALAGHWTSFASRLTQSAQVLDIGCGAGAAGQALLGGRAKLRIVGVDVADVPPSRDVRIELISRTAMERLPFANASFDAAISQFGFEYGSVADAALELARVTRPSAPISLLVHHSEGRIATDSETHRQALEALCGEPVEAAFTSGNSAILVGQLARIRRACPHEAIIEQAAHGLMRHIASPRPQRAELWRAVKAALLPELVLLAALEHSRVSPKGVQQWLRPLGEGFDLQPPAAIKMADGSPLCWKIEGVRRPT